MRTLNEAELCQVAQLVGKALEQSGQFFIELANKQLEGKHYRLVLIDWSDPPDVIRAKIEEVPGHPSPQGHIGFRH